MSIKTQETCKPVPPRWTTAKIQAEKRVCVLCVNPAICAVCAVLAVRSFNNLRWHNRGRGFESHPLRHRKLSSPVKPLKNITFVLCTTALKSTRMPPMNYSVHQAGSEG